jgi:predicted ester cyclase
MTQTKPEAGMTEQERVDRASIQLEGRDISHFTRADLERRQSLQGFDAEFPDFVDYIIRITHRIWEEKAIGTIYAYYSHNCPIHMADGLIYGREAVVAGTVRTLAAFPDVRLYGDEVIWSGNERDGFHSSHRITWTGRNTGHSQYGPPTGKKILRRGIAHCFVKDNRIIEEWIARDELALIRQLGLDEIELARAMGARDLERQQGNAPVEFAETPRVRGQEPPLEMPPAPPHFDPEDFAHRVWQEIWNWRMLNRLEDYYHRNAVAFVSTNRKLEGLQEYAHFVLQMLAAFPDGAMLVDHVAWNGSAERGYKIAVRWTFIGTHEGPSGYGRPTGRRIRALGITHLEVSGGKVAREYGVFDEFAVLKQIHAPEPLWYG